MTTFATILEASPISQLVVLYNQGLELLGHTDSFIKKFADKKIAVARIEKQAEKLLAMHSYTDIEISESGLRWVIEKPAPAKPAKTERATESTGQGRTTISMDAVYTVVATANPKRRGSRSALVWEFYRSGETVAEYIERMEKAGHGRRLALATLHWDEDKGFIKIGA